MMSYAEEDPLEDEAEAEVEGEADVEEISQTTGQDQEDERKSTASPDADTTLLFVKPAVGIPTSQLGNAI